MKLNEFKPGDYLELTGRDKRGETISAAIVTAVDYNGLGLITYTGRYGTKLPISGSGAFNPEKVGTTPYGFYCEVKIVGHSKPRRHEFKGPRPGDRHFDLMC
jgi:hypothetical protein